MPLQISNSHMKLSGGWARLNHSLLPGEETMTGEAAICTRSQSGSEAAPPRLGVAQTGMHSSQRDSSLTLQDLPFLGSWSSRNNGLHIDPSTEHSRVNATLKNTRENAPPVYPAWRASPACITETAPIYLPL